MTQAAGHPVSNHRGAHRLADNQSEPRPADANDRSGCYRSTVSFVSAHNSVIPVHERVYDQISPPDSLATAHRPGEVGTMMQPIRLRQHPSVRKRGSGSEGSAALAATRRDDGATRTGAHPEAEAVNPRPTTVVRLERPLALGHGQHSSSWWAPFGARSLSVIRMCAMNRDVIIGARRSWRTRSSTTSHGQHRTATAPRGDCTRVLIGC